MVTLSYAQTGPAQPVIESGNGSQKVVVVTGARFAYDLVERWIDAYHEDNPGIQIVVESRGSADPPKFDVLAEVYEHDEALKGSREYIYVGRYAVLPVAHQASPLARTYAEKGLNADAIKQIFFHDIFNTSSKQKAIDEPYTVYTRLQKAGVPMVFAEHFGYEQKDLKGTSIAGADSHLLRAILRDTTGVTYLPLSLIYDRHTRTPVPGAVVLPVDLNGNKKVSDDEKFFGDLDHVIETLEAQDPGKIRNIPVNYLHLSVDKHQASAAAIDFMNWVNEHGHQYLREFGYLQPEGKHAGKEKFRAFASRRKG